MSFTIQRLVLHVLSICWCLSNGEVFDLTYVFAANKTVYWPGSKEFNLTNLFRGEYPTPNGPIWVEEEEYGAASHGGTHMDAPSHMYKGGWTVDQIPAQNLYGPLVLINIVDKVTNDRNYQLQIVDLERHEAHYGRIPDGAIVVIKSGWYKYWPDKLSYLGTADGDITKLSFPGFSVSSATWLATQRRINGVGIDTASMDPGNLQDFPAHRIILANKLFGLENVALTDAVPERGALLVAAPLKDAGASGGPCRILAFTGNSRTVFSSSPLGTKSSILLLILSWVVTSAACTRT